MDEIILNVYKKLKTYLFLKLLAVHRRLAVEYRYPPPPLGGTNYQTQPIQICANFKDKYG